MSVNTLILRMIFFFPLVLTVLVCSTFKNAFFSVAIASKAAHHIALKSVRDYKLALSLKFLTRSYSYELNQDSFLC